MNRLPDMGTPRCEVLSSPKQVRELLETSEHAEQVALDVQTEGPGRGRVCHPRPAPRRYCPWTRFSYSTSSVAALFSHTVM